MSILPNNVSIRKHSHVCFRYSQTAVLVTLGDAPSDTGAHIRSRSGVGYHGKHQTDPVYVFGLAKPSVAREQFERSVLVMTEYTPGSRVEVAAGNKSGEAQTCHVECGGDSGDVCAPEVARDSPSAQLYFKAPVILSSRSLTCFPEGTRNVSKPIKPKMRGVTMWTHLSMSEHPTPFHECRPASALFVSPPNNSFRFLSRPSASGVLFVQPHH